MSWKPISKVAYALVVAIFVDTGILMAFLSGALDWRGFLAALVGVTAPVVAAYLRGEPAESWAEYAKGK